MEVLKLVRELAAMARHLEVRTLGLLFRPGFQPADSRDLVQSIQHFQPSSIDSSDYRSAYHMTHDWLYGWNVHDASDFEDGVKEYLEKARAPRAIIVGDAWEREEMEKIIKTFQTLHTITSRSLAKEYMEVEEIIPRVGKGLGASSLARGDGLDDGTDRPLQRYRVFGETRPNTQPASTTATGEAGAAWPNQESASRAATPRPLGEGAEAIRANTGVPDSPGGKEGSERVVQGALGGLAGFTMDLSHTDVRAALDVGAALSRTSTGAGAGTGTTKPDNYFALLRRDISLVYVRLEKCVDLALLQIVITLMIMSLSELAGNLEVHKRFHLLANDMAMEFVKRSLKSLWDMLALERVDAQLEDVRDMARLRATIKLVMEGRAVGGKVPKLRLRKLPAKMSTLHTLFTALDIHVLPNFVLCHANGLKSICPSIYEPYIWLTGGYDCSVKIHDIRKENDHACLGHFVGHRSIVTFVKFIRADSMVVSASFDRTIKIWNANSAVCERTLTGHTDAILCCDVSPDHKQLVSGSSDCTMRVWELASGECVNVVRKHTRWIKTLRFSPDGKYVASGGLDRRIYVWESKSLLASRAVMPVRCFENHNDYILDLAFDAGNRLLSTSRDMTLRLMDLRSGTETDCIHVLPSWVTTLCFSENREFFVTGSFDNNLHIYRTATLERIRTLRVFNMGILSLRLLPDMSQLVVGTAEGYLQEIPL